MHCHHRRTEPRRQVTRTENFVKFGLVVFATCKNNLKVCTTISLDNCVQLFGHWQQMLQRL